MASRMKRFEVHRSRVYIGADQTIQGSFIVNAAAVEIRGEHWLALVDDNNRDVAVFARQDITGVVQLDD